MELRIEIGIIVKEWN